MTVTLPAAVAEALTALAALDGIPVDERVAAVVADYLADLHGLLGPAAAAVATACSGDPSDSATDPDPEPPPAPPPPPARREYRCSCDRTFETPQGLGGHRSSCKKAKASTATDTPASRAKAAARAPCCDHCAGRDGDHARWCVESRSQENVAPAEEEATPATQARCICGRPVAASLGDGDLCLACYRDARHEAATA